MFTCAPSIARVLSPLALQIRRESASRASSEQVPPVVERQPLKVRIARISLVLVAQLVRRGGEVGLLSNVDGELCHDRRVVLDVRCYLRIVRGGERRGGGCEEGDERVVRRGALE